MPPISNGYTYTITGSDCIVTDYDTGVSSHGTDPVPPATLDGYNVIELDVNSFASKSLTSVTLNNVVDLDDRCFYNNPGLTVTINANVTTNGIGSTYYAPFHSCAIAGNLTIGASVTVLDDYLFAYSGVSGSLTFPSNVTNIDQYVFQYCTGITTITLDYVVSLKNKAFADCGTISVNLNANVTTNGIGVQSYAPFSGCTIAGNLTIGASVTVLDDYLFAYSGVSGSLTTWANLTDIDAYCFYNCSLSTVTLNHAVDLANNCFYNNPGLTVAVNANVTTVGTTSYTVGPFESCSIGNNWSFGSSVTTIDDHLFASAGLTGSFTTWANLTAIKDYAFRDCDITTFTFNHTIDLGDNCFYGSNNITINLNANITTTAVASNGPFEGNTVGSNLTIDDAVTTITAFTFDNCGLTEIALSKNITSVGNYAFSDNLNLATVIVPNSLTTFGTHVLDGCMTGAPPKGTIYGNSGSTAETLQQSYSSYYDFGLYLSNTISKKTVKILILEYQSTESAEAGTTTTNIKVTGHGLVTGDFIVNSTRRSTSQSSAERGSRKITKVDADNFTVDAVASQTTSDSILLFTYVDRTDKVKVDSLTTNLKAEGDNSAQFTMIFDKTTFDIYEGALVKITIDDELYMRGVVSNLSCELTDDKSSIVNCGVTITGLNNIPSRRTIKINYALGDATDDIVNDMIDNYLYQDGIEAGTIDTGIDIGEDWVGDAISIAEVLDNCADKNGFYWHIDKDMKLNFYQNPASITIAPGTIVDGGDFTEFSNMRLNTTIDGYINKLFSVGANDEYGNQIFAIRGDLTEQNAMQARVGGTGVYGFVNRNGSVTEFEEDLCEAGTTTTNITIAGHSFVVGDFVWNYTRNITTYVTTVVDANNVTVETVASQTTGDTLIWYPSNNLNSESEMRRSSIRQMSLSFTTHQTPFAPQQKINIAIARFGISSSYWNIENVRMNVKADGICICTIECVLRDTTAWSTRRQINGKDFFNKF